ncbi:TRAP transporter large permease subunit, partial [Lutimaribacter sp. EGI FJ00014]|nr:TRAP transporter large permease subunit [Lutimaribacter sp. EGI FJ00014]
ARITTRVGGRSRDIVTSLAGVFNWPALNRQASLSAKGIWRGENVTLEAASSQPLVLLGGGSAPVLLVLSAVVCIVLGMGLPTLGVYVLLAALVAPALVAVGIEPIAAHLFVLYFGMMSMITPPIAIAAFAAASIAHAPAMKTGFASAKFGWSAFIVPFLFVFSPTLLLIGEPLDIVFAVVTAGAGVWLVSAALAGYFATRLSIPMRLLFGLAGLMALVPAGAFAGAIYSDIVGVGGGAVLLAVEAYRAREQRKKALS